MGASESGNIETQFLYFASSKVVAKLNQYFLYTVGNANEVAQFCCFKDFNVVILKVLSQPIPIK